MSFSKDIEIYSELEKELHIEKNLAIEKAMKSGNPSDILAASRFLNSNKPQTKSFLYDPQSLNDSLGFKEKASGTSYGMLRRMARTPIIKSIITTRVEQVAAFSEPQDENKKIGWSIRKKRRLFQSKLNNELTDLDKREIEGVINFITNCGVGGNENWMGNNFDEFLRKYVKDLLEMDQGTFEIVNTRGLKPHSFFATDGATHRLASSFHNAKIKEGQIPINGYYPAYVQIYQGLVRQEYYPWELSFGTRNINTGIYNNGYGTCELEDMVQIVTWQLHGDQYNGKFFSQGSSPKGMFKVTGAVDDDKLNEFRNQWRNQVAGVENAWRVPILQGDGVDWIDMQKSNTDMEFSRWSEYLIKLSCALYKIAPEEIGFSINGGGEGAINYNGNQEYRLEYSKDKGLNPLLRFIADKINKFLVYRLTDSKYEFYWTGINDEDSLDDDIKAMAFTGLKEIRAKRGLPAELDKDDVVLNAVWVQLQQMKMQGAQGSNEFVDGQEGGANVNPFINTNLKSDDKPSAMLENPFGGGNNKNDNPYNSKDNKTGNPFMTDFIDQVNKMADGK